MANKLCKLCCFKGQKMVIGIILLLLAFLLITGCSPPDQKKAALPEKDSGSAFYSLAVLNRFGPGLNAETARGKALYLQKCFICHGKSGDGKGFNAYNLKSNFGVEPFNFKDSADKAFPPIAEIKKAITGGGPAVNKSQFMPPWGATFTGYDIDCITGYVWRSLMGQKTK